MVGASRFTLSSPLLLVDIDEGERQSIRLPTHPYRTHRNVCMSSPVGIHLLDWITRLFRQHWDLLWLSQVWVWRDERSSCKLLGIPHSDDATWSRVDNSFWLDQEATILDIVDGESGIRWALDILFWCTWHHLDVDSFPCALRREHLVRTHLILLEVLFHRSSPVGHDPWEESKLELFVAILTFVHLLRLEILIEVVWVNLICLEFSCWVWLWLLKIFLAFLSMIVTLIIYWHSRLLVGMNYTSAMLISFVRWALHRGFVALHALFCHEWLLSTSRGLYSQLGCRCRCSH